MLLTWNNLSYYQDLMQDMRDAIEAQRFEAFSAETTERWARGDLPALRACTCIAGYYARVQCSEHRA